MARSGELMTIGARFSRLVVVAAAGKDAYRNLLWECICECGETTVKAGYRLRSGGAKSCGCLQRESVASRNHSHGLTGSRLYAIWANMRSRCGNPRNAQYMDYGGRGITICREWSEFEQFSTWSAVSGYSDDLSIDRVDNDGGYSPSNCRWATAIDQARNKRPRRDQKLSDAQVDAIRLDHRSQQEIAASYGVRQQHISRIKRSERRAFPTARANQTNPDHVS